MKWNWKQIIIMLIIATIFYILGIIRGAQEYHKEHYKIGAVIKATDPLKQDIQLIRELHRIGKNPCIKWD